MTIRFSSILQVPCGIRYVFEQLNLASAFSAQRLKETAMCIDPDEIQSQYKALAEVCRYTAVDGDLQPLLGQLGAQLSHLKEVRTSLLSLQEGSLPDDVELFEIKSLLMINERVRAILDPLHLACITLPDLSQLLEVLDPENAGVGSFYIYDAYDSDLAALRRQLRSADAYAEELQYKIALLESKIRRQLSGCLAPHSHTMLNALLELARLDILLAKALQVHQWGLVIPEVASGKTSYQGLFNPEVRDLLHRQGKTYQVIDIGMCTKLPLLITGANMGGKSLSLKTLALAQLLFQFGFGIPASSAQIMPVADLFLSVGDHQDYSLGMSSFSAEMKRIDQFLGRIEAGEKVLALIDEPARTTNPPEGAALTTALIRLLGNHQAPAVLTTHYNIGPVACQRLRVKGFDNGHMDYQLIADSGQEVPREALKIAFALGINPLWLDLAQKELEQC